MEQIETNEILTTLINKGSYVHQFNEFSNQNRLIIKHGIANSLKSDNIRYLAVLYSVIGERNYSDIHVQYFFPWELNEAIDTFIKRLNSPYPSNRTSCNRSLQEIEAANSTVPKVYDEKESIESYVVTKEELLKSFLTHNGVAYIYNNNTSLQIFRCKFPNKDNKFEDRIIIIYSDYNEITNSNSETYLSDEVIRAMDIFIERLTSSNPSISLVKGL